MVKFGLFLFQNLVALITPTPNSFSFLHTFLMHFETSEYVSLGVRERVDFGILAILKA